LLWEHFSVPSQLPRRKTIGNIGCIRLAHEQGYECDFAIDIKHQTIELGRVC
jgi:hypothetical protein